jgi:hypothetical protein
MTFMLKIEPNYTANSPSIHYEIEPNYTANSPSLHCWLDLAMNMSLARLFDFLVPRPMLLELRSTLWTQRKFQKETSKF